MKLATLQDGTRDGQLVKLSTDLGRMISCAPVVGTMQQLMEEWDRLAPALESLDPSSDRGSACDAARLLAPLPRAWQWLDGSAFTSHGDLLQLAYDLPPVPTYPPLMYQGMSHRFLAADADVPLPDEKHGIDFEAEYGVIVDDVPMGISAEAAADHIKLIVLINDWSLRTLGAAEMRTGFGWVTAKPACSMAPVAVTPDELSESWRDGRIHLPVLVDYNGSRFGAAHGSAMSVGFHELVAHAATTRDLCAGTIIGSGTVSNEDFRSVGSSCIAERRAIEKVDLGAPATPFMQFGDRVRIEVLAEGRSVFGAIDQAVSRRAA